MALRKLFSLTEIDEVKELDALEIAYDTNRILDILSKALKILKSDLKQYEENLFERILRVQSAYSVVAQYVIVVLRLAVLIASLPQGVLTLDVNDATL
jgi:hypothetical protein